MTQKCRTLPSAQWQNQKDALQKQTQVKKDILHSFGLSFAHWVVYEIYHFSDIVLALEYNIDSVLDLRESRGRPADPWPEIWGHVIRWGGEGILSYLNHFKNVSWDRKLPGKVRSGKQQPLTESEWNWDIQMLMEKMGRSMWREWTMKNKGIFMRYEVDIQVPACEWFMQSSYVFQSPGPELEIIHACKDVRSV